MARPGKANSIITLSLWQPWAQLMALGYKTVETRHWSVGYRGPMAIHAAKRATKNEKLHFEAWDWFFRDHGFHAWHDLPLGCVIAIGELVNIIPTEKNDRSIEEGALYGDGMTVVLSENELAFGDYSEGRYGWVFQNMTMLPDPIPAKGSQGLWEWQVPDAIDISLIGR